MKTIKVLHLTPETYGYEEVELLANAINRTNNLAAIREPNSSKVFMTGGFIIKDTPKIREILDNLSIKAQYNFIRDIREIPYVKQYYEND